MRTKLQGGTVVGFNGRSHVLIRDGVVVWEDDRITFVGQVYDGPVEVGAPAVLVEQLATQVERFGVRAYLGPGYRSASQSRDADGVIQYDWDEAAGHQGLAAACRFISAHDGQAHGRVRGMLYPLQVDTCSRELLQATRQAAESLRVPVQIHTG